MKKQTLALSLLVTLMGTNGFAANITISGVIPSTVTLNQTNSTANGLMNTSATTKYIELEHIILSPSAKKYLADHIGQTSKTLLNTTNPAPLQADVGMNEVPVLDQGQHGTCATFATTAALDAVLGHTDHISQLCNLELGATLETLDKNYPSGWEGSTNEIILDQAKKYGTVSTEYQIKYGCANVHFYPAISPRNTGHAMKVDDFLKHSDKIMTAISWNVLLNSDDALSDKAKLEEVLNNTKLALANGHRVVIGTLIDENRMAGENGAAGTNKVKYDTWVLTPVIEADAKADKIDAGHALVITGYDDNATVVDTNHVQHKGVLTLRNSWGASAGDKGNYYMSYDYFTSLVMSVSEILPNA